MPHLEAAVCSSRVSWRTPDPATVGPRLCWFRECDRPAGQGISVLFFAGEEQRAHVHVHHAQGEAKFWIDPTVELAANFGLKPKQIADVQTLIEEHLNEIRAAWARHFAGGGH